MNGTVFGAHYAPSAFGLDAAECRRRLGRPPAHAGGMRCLIEAVGRGDRPDLHWLEQDIVTWISHLIPLVERMYNKELTGATTKNLQTSPGAG